MSIQREAASAILRAIDEFKEEVDLLFEAERGTSMARGVSPAGPERFARASGDPDAPERSAPLEPARLVAAREAPHPTAADRTSSRASPRPAQRVAVRLEESQEDDSRKRLDALAKRLGDRARRARASGAADGEAGALDAGGGQSSR
jgi:hypothetical protein